MDMKRRSFFAALLAAPFIPYAAKSAQAAKAPFIIQDGVLYLNEVKVNSLSALSGVLGNVDITGCCYTSPLSVGSSNIEVDRPFEDGQPVEMVSILRPDGSVESVPRLHRKVILKDGILYEQIGRLSGH
jgi:hypothetical protein